MSRDEGVADQSGFSESSIAGLELARGSGQLVQTSSACLSPSERWTTSGQTLRRRNARNRADAANATNPCVNA